MFRRRAELAAAAERLKDVAGLLAFHGVQADCLPMPRDKDDSAGLRAIAQEQGADLVIAGAYGHSRLREWALWA